MKKLLVLALVLSLVGYVNAGLVTGNLVAGKLTYSADLDTKIVSIIASAPVIALEMGALIPDGLGTVVPGTKAFANGGVGESAEGLGMTSYPAGTIVNVSGNTGSPTGILGTIMTFGFTDLPNFITIQAETEWGLMGAKVDFQDSSQASGISSVDLVGVQIVPEPMTMVLLGLGGLFLRKKK